MNTVEIDTDTRLADFQDRIADQRARFNRAATWHLEALQNGNITPPYRGDETWLNVTEYDYEGTKDTNPNYGKVDVEATQLILAKVIKYATKVGAKVEKRYDTHDFNVEVTATDGFSIHYYASRETVCERKVIGTKVIPAITTAERIEEIVEWECEKVSFLAIDTEE